MKHFWYRPLLPTSSDNENMSSAGLSRLNVKLRHKQCLRQLHALCGWNVNVPSSITAALPTQKTAQTVSQLNRKWYQPNLKEKFKAMVIIQCAHLCRWRDAGARCLSWLGIKKDVILSSNQLFIPPFFLRFGPACLTSGLSAWQRGGWAVNIKRFKTNIPKSSGAQLYLYWGSKLLVSSMDDEVKRHCFYSTWSMLTHSV